MSEHTKGPWLLVEKPHTRGAHDTQPHLEYFHIQGPEGDVDPDLGIAGFMKRADAKLIAAAPDLLEACRAAWNCIGELPPTQARVEVGQMLYAAIAKAAE